MNDLNMTATRRTETSATVSDHGAARPSRHTRQGFLKLGALALAPLGLAACGGRVAARGLADGVQASRTLALTPANLDEDDLELTPEQTEGPYFKRNSPERTSLAG